MIRSFIIAIVVAAGISANGCAKHGAAKKASKPLGVEAFLAAPPAVVKGKRVGLITNHTGVDAQGRSDIDTLRASGVQLVALFGPEHGIRGDAHAGAKVTDSVDAKTGIPVYSLYGSGADSRKPKPETLKDVDVLMFDIQDVGARCYTYPYTMALGMQAAKENGIPFVVLDRPNPIGGEIVEGNLLDPAFSSFVGMYRIPMRHGMTVGELAQLFNTEFGIGADLTVVRVPGWRRSQWHDATGLQWLPPSPALPWFESTIHYPGTVAFEGTNLSCGRGTEYPFEQVGAPWLDSAKVVEAMNAAGLSGVRFEPVKFTPSNAGDRKYEGEACQGIKLVVLDRNVYRPVRTSYVLVEKIRAAHPEQFKFRNSHFDRLAGTDKVRLAIEGGTLNEFIASWDADEKAFRETRKPYLLYK